MLIAHTADIHIRSLSRHDEYRQVFQAFIDDCKSQKVDHIFVGGDIFHTKVTGISPEYIDLLTWWVNSMSKVAPVHMILGNHDLNLSNLSRQDAVSPILEAINNPRVFLYKDSGTYKIENGYNLCVFSICDEPGWEKVAPIPGEINIACYHGPVKNSVTETGWGIEDGITNEFFKDYDFVLLGDIHQQQYLGYRDDKPWIAYPGTLIQQNYSEVVDHGYLLWNITDKDDWTVKNRPLPNPKPFVTIDWEENLEKTLEIAQKHVKGSRFRIRTNVQVTQDDVHRLSENLKTFMSATEVTYKSEYQPDKQAIRAGTSTLAKKDLRSPEVVTKLLKEFHSESNLTDEELQLINDQSKTYLSAVSTVEGVNRGSKWSLKHLKWDNLFSYGEGNEIDFDKLKGIVGIFGPNRTGKSSIVGTIMYSLFNTTDRGPVKNINVCNIRKPFCSSRAVIDHNGTTYVIERQTTKTTNKKGVTSAATSLNLFRMREDGEFDDLCGEQRSDTEKSIKSLIGISEDFLMTTLSAQGETNQFLSQGSSVRRSVLTKFLDLDIFDKMHDLASKDVSGIKYQLKNFPDRDWENLIKQNEIQLSSYKSELKDIASKISDSQSTLSLLRDELSKHNASATTQFDVDRQKDKVEDLKNKSKECRDKITALEQEIEDLQEKHKVVQELINKNDISELRVKLESQRSLEKSITELKHIYEKEMVQLNQQQKSLKILDEVPCGDDYPTCKFIKDAHANKSNVAAQSVKVEDSLKSLQKAQNAFDKIKDEGLVEKIEKHEKAVNLSTKINLEISKKETEIEKIRSSCDSCADTLKEAVKKLKQLEDAVKNQQNEEVVSIRSKIDELSDKIRDWDVTKIQVAAHLGKLLSNIEKLNEEKLSRDSLLKNIRIHELISSAFSKKGIPLVVTRSQLPVINSEVAKILQGIVDFTIEIESDEDTDALEIYINYGDSRRVIELCSGMEKTIASIALRVAMFSVSSLPKPDFFIIDEGFGTLDSSGVEACNRLLTSLKKYFKTIIVITHVDGIKDAADHVIDITKIEKDSKVECI
jgi:DNA repair exonuclease SbcCD ATPase subunit/DNA repair exonuclease SbcCD nuclease subunit